MAVSGLIQAAPPLAHHKLQVRITPAENHLWVRDEITGPACGKEKPLHFLLHGNLKITSCSAGISIKKESGQLTTEFSGINTAQFEIEKKIPIQHYSITFQSDTAAEKTFFLEYEGKINHPIKKNGGEYARGFSETPGIIDGKGAYLAGASFWYPWFNDNLFTYHMETTVPKDWDTVSQGKRAKHDISGQTRITTWDSPEPMDEIYLSAAKFKEYSIKVGKVDVLAFLRSEDRGLANKYLETTGQYLEMYERLIGRYPYSKFALIENFWETGYGMP
ncbi:MAG: M1 family metallopeptidase, partial [bacterium]|nr:M1 family metallopeptidase [bacterium]